MTTNSDLLLIFTRNPKLGKCKTRLATKVGEHAALAIYNFLLGHTVSITQNLKVGKCVYYSQEIWEDDIWDNAIYQKKLQNGEDLGKRMENAFKDGFGNGYQKIIIIGSDMYELSQADLEHAFAELNEHDYVVGPAVDGGYYLLGMKKMRKNLFEDKDWGKETVLENTLNDLIDEKYALLDPRNDVDHFEDIVHIKAFQPFLKHMHQ